MLLRAQEPVMLIVGVACRLCAVWKQARCCGCDVRGNGQCSLVVKFSQPTDISEYNNGSSIVEAHVSCASSNHYSKERT
jgi:hypothetical protein